MVAQLGFQQPIAPEVAAGYILPVTPQIHLQVTCIASNMQKKAKCCVLRCDAADST